MDNYQNYKVDDSPQEDMEEKAERYIDAQIEDILLNL